MLFITAKQFVKAGVSQDAISEFENGQDAIENFENRINLGKALPAFILLDINMPLLDGWGFLEEWRVKFPNTALSVRICICTSSLDHEDLIRANSTHLIQDYFVKPIEASVIDEIIQKHFSED